MTCFQDTVKLVNMPFDNDRILIFFKLHLLKGCRNNKVVERILK